jgi:hypothetical protein
MDGIMRIRGVVELGCDGMMDDYEFMKWAFGSLIEIREDHRDHRL